MKHWMIVTGLLIAFVAAWYFRAQSSEHRFHQELYSEIEFGMTRSSVQTIFGRTPGPADPSDTSLSSFELVKEEGDNSKSSIWSDKHGQVVVSFDSWATDARVVGKQWYRSVGKD